MKPAISGKKHPVKFFIIVGLTLFSFPLFAQDDTHISSLTNNQVKLSVRTHQYTVLLDKHLREAQVEVCFDGKAPQYLMVDYEKAKKTLLEFPVTRGGDIKIEGRYWKTDNLDDNACIHYQSDISAHLVQPKLAKTGQATISFQSDNTWLWLPEKFDKDESAEILFKLPPDYEVSTPWELIGEKTKRYRIGRASHDLGFTLMIGQFELRKIVLDENAQINIALMPSLKQKDKLENWIFHSAKSIVDYLGQMPTQHLQVILLENKRFKKGPVPWGDIKRGGGFGLRFVVNSEYAIKDFYSDWTATHEFSHLLIPIMVDRDLWLSEGLSSYLQYVLMAQSGVLTEQQLWQKLHAGFLRGEKGTQKVKSETLLEASEEKDEKGSYQRTMRIYWSGAAYFLKADWLLRKNSNGRMGLPDVLLKLNHCCINSTKEWSGQALSEKLDHLSQTQIFSQLYRDIAHSKNFPSTAELIKQLGIKVLDDKVFLFPSKESAIRKAILKH